MKSKSKKINKKVKQNVKKLKKVETSLKKPRSKITDRFQQESTENRWNVETVFSSEIFRIFFDAFQPVHAGKHRKLTGSHRKKSNKFPVGTLLPFLAISGTFLQDPVTFTFLSFRILRDPVTVIFDLGS